MEENKQYLDLEGLEYYTEKILELLKNNKEELNSSLELGKLGATE